MIKLSCRSISCRWDGPGANPFGVNLRAIMAFREIGKGHTGSVV